MDLELLQLLQGIPLADLGPELSDEQMYGLEEIEHDDGGATLTLIVLCVMAVGLYKLIFAIRSATRERRVNRNAREYFAKQESAEGGAKSDGGAGGAGSTGAASESPQLPTQGASRAATKAPSSGRSSGGYTSSTEAEEQTRVDALARRLDAIKKRQKD